MPTGYTAPRVTVLQQQVNCYKPLQYYVKNNFIIIKINFPQIWLDILFSYKKKQSHFISLLAQRKQIRLTVFAHMVWSIVIRQIFRWEDDELRDIWSYIWLRIAKSYLFEKWNILIVILKFWSTLWRENVTYIVSSHKCLFYV